MITFDRKSYNRAWRIKNRDHVNESRRKWRNIPEVNARWKLQQKIYRKNAYSKKRKLVFDHYGNECACCEENISGFLSIDHVNGGGRKHYKEIKLQGFDTLYSWLVKNNFPDGFRTLCHNCNMAIGIYGICPHKS